MRITKYVLKCKDCGRSGFWVCLRLYDRLDDVVCPKCEGKNLLALWKIRDQSEGEEIIELKGKYRRLEAANAL